jgi:hypothetical protein
MRALKSISSYLPVVFLSTLVGLNLSVNGAASHVGGAEPVIHQKLALTLKSDGIDGSLEVLRDGRLTASDIKAMQEHDPDAAPENAPRFKSDPLKPATLSLKSLDGRLVQSLTLEKPYASIEAIEIAKGKRIILLTQDYSVGMGSYNGPITRILETTPRSMRWVRAHNAVTGKEDMISLMRSLKTAWNFSRSGAATDILAVSCRPSDSMDKFKTTFSRYHHNGQGWILRTRSEGGLWEAEDGDQRLGYALPSLKKFPDEKGSS